MRSIPELSEPELYGDRDFGDFKFVEILSNDIITVDMQYPKMGMRYAEQHCFVREEVYQMLKDAANQLPAGYRFKIFDAWRPFVLQQELYEVYSDKIMNEFHLEGSSEEQKRAVIKKFVSEPVWDRDIPPVHTTGGAIDLTIIGKDGQELEMGTGFDAFTEKTYTSFFEKNEEDVVIRDNRRLLYHVMTEAGFTNLPSEWWHFDYGDRFWAFYNKKPALYRGVFTREEMH
ncbi:MAG: M15 family metallopeptidase [Lachnospiraceae bacterium]|nr:M15 family metallopeptidase [Lachnospiraceae bacterium]